MGDKAMQQTGQRVGYMTRLERVLQRKFELSRHGERRALRRISGVGAAFCGAVVCFFLLKAATLAYMGEQRFQDGIGADIDRTGGLSLWLVGIDPVTRVLAETLEPGSILGADG